MSQRSGSKSIIAIQADQIKSWKYETDSTLLFATEFQKRGYQIFLYTPEKLSLHSSGEVFATGRFVELFEDPSGFFAFTSELVRIQLDEARLIMIRQNPPFNETYVANTWILNHVKNQKKIINHPSAIRDVSEKLWAYNFPEFLPTSVVTSNAHDAIEFARNYDQVIIKSIFNFGGNDVTRLTVASENFEESVEKAIKSFGTIILQEFLTSITATGDKRILISCGKTVGAINRMPPAGSILANMGAGGAAHTTIITDRENEISEKVASKLLEKGIYIAGLDLIDERLIEINVTSPTGFKAYNTLYGTHCEKLIVEELLTYAENS